MTLSFLDTGCGTSTPPPRRDWTRVLGALAAALLLLLISGPFYCASVPPPGRLLHDDPQANYATTWSHSESKEGGLG